MLRKLLTIALALALVLSGLTARAEDAARESTVDEVQEITGLLLAPDSAENLIYRVLSGNTAECAFTLDGASWTLRAVNSDTDVDPSGCAFSSGADAPLAEGDCAGFFAAAEGIGARFRWYDEGLGIAWSLLCSDFSVDARQVAEYARNCWLYQTVGAWIMLDAYLTSGYRWQPVAYDPNLFTVSAGADIPPQDMTPGASGVTMFAVAALAAEGKGEAAFACLPLAGDSDGSEEVVEYSLEIMNGFTLTDEIKPELRVGTFADFAPFEFKNENGELTGFDVELIDLLMKRMNRDYTLTELPFVGILDTLGNGTDAVISALSITPERQEIALFSDPYFDESLVLVAPKDGVKTIAELAGKKVGAEKDSTGAFFIAGALASSEAVMFDSLDEAVAALGAGEVAAVVTDMEPAKICVSHAESLCIMDENLSNDHFGIAVATWDENLAADLNEALADVKDSGEFEALYLKYFAQ